MQYNKHKIINKKITNDDFFFKSKLVDINYIKYIDFYFIILFTSVQVIFTYLCTP